LIIERRRTYDLQKACEVSPSRADLMQCITQLQKLVVKQQRINYNAWQVSLTKL